MKFINWLLGKDKPDEVVFDEPVETPEQCEIVEPRDITLVDAYEMEEAARQLSHMVGCSEDQAMRRIIRYGIETGKLKPDAKPPKPLKNCILCQKPHRHSNAFCSAECCKLYKEAKKGGKQ